MIDIPLLRELAQLGLSGVVAVIVLLWKRADDARYTKSIEDMNKALLTALDANTRALLGIQTNIEAQSTRRQQEEELRELREMMRGQRSGGGG